MVCMWHVGGQKLCWGTGGKMKGWEGVRVHKDVMCVYDTCVCMYRYKVGGVGVKTGNKKKLLTE